MAIIKLSALASDIKGRLGGTVFQRSSAGLAMRSQPGLPRVKNSVNTEALAGMALCQWSWQALDPTARSLWQSYSVFRPRPTRKNINVFMNGQGVYVYENHLRYMMRGFGSIFNPVINDNPVLSQPPLQLTPTFFFRSGSDFFLSTNENIAPTTEGIILYMSKPMPSSKQSAWFKSKMIRFEATMANANNINDAYLNAWYQLPESGQYVGYEMARYDNNLKTVSSFARGIAQVTS